MHPVFPVAVLYFNCGLCTLTSVSFKIVYISIAMSEYVVASMFKKNGCIEERYLNDP